MNVSIQFRPPASYMAFASRVHISSNTYVNMKYEKENTDHEYFAYCKVLDSTTRIYNSNLLDKISCMYPAGNYMFKVNSRNTRTRCEICSKLTLN